MTHYDSRIQLIKCTVANVCYC